MMYSSSKFHISDRFKCLLLGGAFDLLGADVPSEFLLEREDAPRGSWLDMLGLQAQHYQIRHKRNGHRSFHSRGILSDLCMPQTQSAFQFLETDLPGKGLARYQAHRPARLQPLPIRTAREVFPQAAHPVSFVERVMGRLGHEGHFHENCSALGSGWSFQSPYRPSTSYRYSLLHRRH